MRYRPTRAVAVRHPRTGALIVPHLRRSYDGDDPLVKAYPWLFEAAGEPAAVEQATKAPGERRARRRG